MKQRIEQILDVLRGVRFPGLDRDIVSLGYVKDVVTVSDRLQVLIEMSTSHPTAGQEIEADARAALAGLGFPCEVVMQVRGPQAAPEQAAPSTAPAAGLLAGVPHKVAVASGKGGVGKSTVAMNLAIAMARLGVSTGILDCDIYGPSIPLMMGLEREQPMIENEKLVPLSRYGVRSISIGYLVDRDTPVIWRGPMVGKALDQLMTDVDWSGIEMMLLDLPPGTGDVQISIAQKVALSGAVIVTTPQDVALIDAAKSVAMFRKVSVPILGIIENMSGFSCPHCGQKSEIFRSGGGKKEADRWGVPLLGEIPIDPRIAVGGDLGTPIVAQNADSEAGRAFIAAATRIRELVEIGGNA